MKKGDKLPDFQLKSSVYGNVSSADLKGKVVLVSLFATWCGEECGSVSGQGSNPRDQFHAKMEA